MRPRRSRLLSPLRLHKFETDLKTGQCEAAITDSAGWRILLVAVVIGIHREGSQISEMKIRSEIVPLPALEELEATWRALEAQCTGSFFTSWGFLGPLLELTKAPPDLFVARRDSEVIALALVARTCRASRLGKIKGLTLNQTGVASEDLVYIEFNDVLCPEEDRARVLLALAGQLGALKSPWAELHLAGFAGGRISSFVSAFGLEEAARKTSPAPWVDLEKVRSEGYLPLLSGNTRRQIERSKRLFEETFGPITLHPVNEEIEIWTDVFRLGDLQIERFEGAARPSSFDTSFFHKFVETLLLAPPSGETRAELLRIDAGETLLGLLVNFCHQGSVSNYQCAFASFPGNNRLKPGLVSHSLAIEHYAGNGARVYHFLGGDQQYKKSLSTDTGQMVWTRLQKPGARLKLESFMKTARARLMP